MVTKAIACPSWLTLFVATFSMHATAADAPAITAKLGYPAITIVPAAPTSDDIIEVRAQYDCIPSTGYSFHGTEARGANSSVVPVVFIAYPQLLLPDCGTPEQRVRVERIGRLPAELYDFEIQTSVGGSVRTERVPVEVREGREELTLSDPTILDTQFWLVGQATLTGDVLRVASAVTGTQANFGADFDPADVARRYWGSFEITFTGCNAGQLSWSSTGLFTGDFGRGAYPIVRFLAPDPQSDCAQRGFENKTDPNWFTGAWWGGPERSGEGLFIDRGNDGVVFVSWFTYRPAQ